MLESLISGLITVGFLMLIAAGWFVLKPRTQNFEDKKKAVLCFIAGALAIIMAIAMLIDYSSIRKDQYNQALNNGYRVYVDGTPVNAENIDITKYQGNHVTYNDENQTILISTD